MSIKPYSEACEQNRAPILSIIKPLLTNCRSVLEIGSGTGQHAVYFAAEMPHLVWQCSDVQEHHAGIQRWLEEAGLNNTPAPIALDVLHDPWPISRFDVVMSANTVHIMSWAAVCAFFTGVGERLANGGLFILYGPFNYGGRYTSESNARFDGWLKARDPQSGVRDFEALDELASVAGLSLTADYEMPVNNRILVWRRDEV